MSTEVRQREAIFFYYKVSTKTQNPVSLENLGKVIIHHDIMHT